MANVVEAVSSAAKKTVAALRNRLEHGHSAYWGLSHMLAVRYATPLILVLSRSRLGYPR